MRLRLQPLALLLLASLAISGCGSTSASSKPVVWTGGSVETFNTYLKDRRGPASPTQLALEFLRADRTRAARLITEARSSPEGGGPTTVAVVQDGLADDSVRATRDVLRFVPANADWRLESAVRTQRCQPGRGHQNFATGDCV